MHGSVLGWLPLQLDHYSSRPRRRNTQNRQTRKKLDHRRRRGWSLVEANAAPPPGDTRPTQQRPADILACYAAAN